MKKIFIINASQVMDHSKGELNNLITEWTQAVLARKNYELQVTRVCDAYDPKIEAQKFMWADAIIFHTPIWWMNLPFKFKEYIDLVYSAGGGLMFKDDGRHRVNPKRNYGTGGLMQGKKYLLTTTWNAPEEAFTLPEEFFELHSVDAGVMFGFHKMNQFCGLSALPSFHFHDVLKNFDLTQSEAAYKKHLENIF